MPLRNSRFHQPLKLLFCGGLFATSALSGFADIIFDNGLPYHPPPPEKGYGYEMTAFVIADDFTLNEATRIESIKIWDLDDPPGYQGSFVWQIYSNSPTNSPGIVLQSGTSTNLLHLPTGYIPDYFEFSDTFDITPTVLPAGTYWLALHNGPLTTTDRKRVYWMTTSNNATFRCHAIFTANFQGDWFPADGDVAGYLQQVAFQINGVVGPHITAIDHSSSGPAQVSFTTSLGQTYRVEYKNDLSNSTWTTVTGAVLVPGTGGVVQVVDLDPTIGTRRFYRVLLL